MLAVITRARQRKVKVQATPHRCQVNAFTVPWEAHGRLGEARGCSRMLQKSNSYEREKVQRSGDPKGQISSTYDLILAPPLSTAFSFSSFSSSSSRPTHRLRRRLRFHSLPSTRRKINQFIDLKKKKMNQSAMIYQRHRRWPLGDLAMTLHRRPQQPPAAAAAATTLSFHLVRLTIILIRF